MPSISDAIVNTTTASALDAVGVAMQGPVDRVPWVAQSPADQTPDITVETATFQPHTGAATPPALQNNSWPDWDYEKAAASVAAAAPFRLPGLPTNESPPSPSSMPSPSPAPTITSTIVNIELQTVKPINSPAQLAIDDAPHETTTNPSTTTGSSATTQANTTGIKIVKYASARFQVVSPECRKVKPNFNAEAFLMGKAEEPWINWVPAQADLIKRGLHPTAAIIFFSCLWMAFEKLDRPVERFFIGHNLGLQKSGVNKILRKLFLSGMLLLEYEGRNGMKLKFPDYANLCEAVDEYVRLFPMQHHRNHAKDK